jgi:hypothetical protein
MVATNNYAPTGFSPLRNIRSAAGNYAALEYAIAGAYGTNIMVGDPVSINSSGLIIAVSGTAASPTNFIGIFAGVLPYYDTVLQATGHGLNGAYITTISPVSGNNVPCLVYTDPDMSFGVQVSASGSPFLQAWQGYNCTWLSTTINQNTAGNGRSVAAIDYNTTNNIGTTNTYPFRIIGPIGGQLSTIGQSFGGPQDPNANNPWIEVKMNSTVAFMNQIAGV